MGDIAHTVEWLLYAMILAYMFFATPMALVIACGLFLTAMFLTDRYTGAYKSALYRTASCDVIVYLVTLLPSCVVVLLLRLLAVCVLGESLTQAHFYQTLADSADAVSVT